MDAAARTVALTPELHARLAAWVGSATHLASVADAIRRHTSGEVTYKAIVSDGDVVAYGGIDYARRAGTGVLWQLTVQPDLRSRGLGAALIDALEADAAWRGLQHVEMSVEVDNPRARQLYERLGYRTVGTETEEWVEDDEQGRPRRHVADCIVMRKDLTAPRRVPPGR